MTIYVYGLFNTICTVLVILMARNLWQKALPTLLNKVSGGFIYVGTMFVGLSGFGLLLTGNTADGDPLSDSGKVWLFSLILNALSASINFVVLELRAREIGVEHAKYTNAVVIFLILANVTVSLGCLYFF